MVTPTYIATCTRVSKLTADVYEVTFSKPPGFTFQSGQFVLFQVPLLDAPADLQARAYSIASLHSDSELKFVIKTFDQGRMSQFLRHKLQPGMALSMQGPFGRFLLDSTPSMRVLFIATGAGVAPFRSHILQALHDGDVRTMDLVFGFRGEADQFWVEEFEAIAAEHSNLRVHIALTRPSSSWKGAVGRVQEVAKTLITDPASTLVYACGHPEMTNDVKKRAPEEWGIPKNLVHVEGYI